MTLQERDPHALATRSAAMIAEACRQRRVCVQAGGHEGWWPLALSQYFDAVYTFEPDFTNWTALVQRASAPHIFPTRGCLGAAPQGMSLQRDVPKSGHWYAVPGGRIPTYTVDGLGLSVDALVLDVEGMELDVLHGAAQTILRDQPVVWFETGMRCTVGHGTPTVIAWLLGHGYGYPQQGTTRDLYMRPAL